MRQVESIGQGKDGQIGELCSAFNLSGKMLRKIWKAGEKMRTYLVVIDDTPEAETALRFAARRAAKTNGCVEILVMMPKQDFLAWGSVQATIEAEARENADVIIARALDMLDSENAITPGVTVQQGTPIEAVNAALGANTEIAALVLGSAANGTPGPLVSHFTGAGATTLKCPVMIIPGGLSREELDRLS